MSDNAMSTDLIELERRLAARQRVDLPPGLGPRVLAACGSAIRRPPTVAPIDTWAYWAATAAVLVAGINLSMSIATATDWCLAPAGPSDATATAARLRTLAPDLPESELRRLALLAWADRGLSPTTAVTPTSEHFRTLQEPDRWDAR